MAFNIYSLKSGFGRQIPFPSSKRVIRVDMPNICQNDSRSAFLTIYGDSACGPASATNIITWLSNNGFPNLLRNKTLRGQLDLLENLYGLMKTDENGTEKNHMIAGLETYILRKGYLPSTQWIGEDPAENYNDGKIIDLSWIREKLERDSNVILLLGSYRFDPSKREYVRTGGHFVTVKGIEGNKLLINDSDPEKNGFTTEYFVSPMTGKLSQKQNLIPINYEPVVCENLIIDGGLEIKVR